MKSIDFETNPIDLKKKSTDFEIDLADFVCWRVGKGFFLAKNKKQEFILLKKRVILIISKMLTSNNL